MKVASIIIGIIILMGFKIETDLPDWMELVIVIVTIVSAVALIIVPSILTYLEHK